VGRHTPLTTGARYRGRGGGTYHQLVPPARRLRRRETAPHVLAYEIAVRMCYGGPWGGRQKQRRRGLVVQEMSRLSPSSLVACAGVAGICTPTFQLGGESYQDYLQVLFGRVAPPRHAPCPLCFTWQECAGWCLRRRWPWGPSPMLAPTSLSWTLGLTP
jgi:hypothetical protein